MFTANFLLAIIAGTLIPLQAGINAKLKGFLSSPYYATIISVAVSLVAITAFCILTRQPVPSQSMLAAVPAWAWTGGIIGVVYIFMVMVLAHKLGATVLVSCIIGGQLICSLLLDQFGLIGFAHHPLNAGRIAGVILLFAGVVLIQKN
jgi:transporter family-2 protein